MFLLHARSYSKVVILSPLRVSTLANYKRAQQYLGDEYAPLLVDSDGGEATRCVNVVSNHWSTNDKVVVSSTFDSVDVLEQTVLASTNCTSTLVIVDEAHNASSELLGKLQTCYRVLLCTATPPTILGEVDDDESSVERDVWNQPPLYTYSFAEAVREKYITDYELRVPLVEEENVTDLHGVQARFLLDGMLRTGSRHTIVYCTSKEHCDTFMKALRRVARDFHNLPDELLWLERVTHDVTPKRRCEILREFEDCSADVYRVVTSVRILDEAIDLPACDSVLILNPTHSEFSYRRTVQQISRAVRLNPNNPNKVARVFMWLVDDTDTPKCLRVLREYDPGYTTKIYAQSFRVYERGTDSNVVLSTEYVQSLAVQQHYRVKCLTVKELLDVKVNMLVDYVRANGRPPVRSYVDEVTKLSLGRFVNYLKCGDVKLTDEQRGRLITAYPAFFGVNDVNTKFDLLVEYLKNNGGKRPCKTYVHCGVNLGTFCHSVRFKDRLSNAQRSQLVDLCPTFFYKRKRDNSRTVPQKIGELCAYFQQKGKWPPCTKKGGYLGKFRTHLRDGEIKLTDQQRSQFLLLDPAFFTKKAQKKKRTPR